MKSWVLQRDDLGGNYNEWVTLYLADDVHAPYGAIIGDICGSIYEWHNRKTKNPSKIELINSKCFFTDDTVLTVAVADALGIKWDYGNAIYEWATKYPRRGYGRRFARWLQSEQREPYNSWGNGSAMRVSPIGWLFRAVTTDDLHYRCNIDHTLFEAGSSACVTHNHPEGIKGAQVVALAIYFARCGKSKDDIKNALKDLLADHRFEQTSVYDLDQTLNEIRRGYGFDESCQGTVPAALIAFFESRDFVSAIQNAISIGGDSDTLACITGSIAEAFYKEIPQELIDFAKSKLSDEMIAALEGTDPKYSRFYYQPNP
jgi:ADP-ribosylglycohydrolase